MERTQKDKPLQEDMGWTAEWKLMLKLSPGRKDGRIWSHVQTTQPLDVGFVVPKMVKVTFFS